MVSSSVATFEHEFTAISDVAFISIYKIINFSDIILTLKEVFLRSEFLFFLGFFSVLDFLLLAQDFLKFEC